MTNSFKTILVLLVFISADASAAIQYVNDGRYIVHTGGSGTAVRNPITPYSPFHIDYWAWEAGAFQDSSMNSTSMTGTGSVYAGHDAMHYGASGRSVYDVKFTVDQLSNFSLSGTTTSAYSPVDGSLFADGIALFSVTSTNSGVGEPFSFNGVFTPGTEYRLTFDTYTNFSDYKNESWQFNLATAPIPEPAAAWLMGLGLFFVMGVARRKAVR